MANIIISTTDLVIPSQDYLTQKTINYYLRSFKKNKQFPPIPVMKDLYDSEKFKVIDNHHHLAVAHYLNHPVKL